MSANLNELKKMSNDDFFIKLQEFEKEFDTDISRNIINMTDSMRILKVHACVYDASSLTAPRLEGFSFIPSVDSSLISDSDLQKCSAQDLKSSPVIPLKFRKK
jgi:hypothetical protein